jgi:hypothetical protein
MCEISVGFVCWSKLFLSSRCGAEGQTLPEEVFDRDLEVLDNLPQNIKSGPISSGQTKRFFSTMAAAGSTSFIRPSGYVVPERDPSPRQCFQCFRFQQSSSSRSSIPS